MHACMYYARPPKAAADKLVVSSCRGLQGYSVLAVATTSFRRRVRVLPKRFYLPSRHMMTTFHSSAAILNLCLDMQPE